MTTNRPRIKSTEQHLKELPVVKLSPTGACDPCGYLGRRRRYPRKPRNLIYEIIPFEEGHDDADMEWYADPVRRSV